MNSKPIHNKKELEAYRIELRKRMTTSEAFLWKQLQKGKLKGRKFRRQHSIKNFIVDFNCLQEKLIIKLNNEVHQNTNTAEKDRKRDKILENLGFNVL